MAEAEFIAQTVTDIHLKAFKMMAWAKYMALTYDENRSITKYVHSTSRGHEAIQLAAAFQLKAFDFAAPYYRDESILLGIGFEPYELMLQLLAKKDDPFSGGRSYYSHPSVKRDDMPIIPHQSSATGMQAIPATGMAQGVKYKEQHGLDDSGNHPVVLCSLGDGSVTEGEVSEAFQFAVLHQLPIIFLVQDNDWGISVTAEEARTMDAYEYVSGFTGMHRLRCDGSVFNEALECMEEAFNYVRDKRAPILVHAKVPLLGHHTSGVRKEFYRTDEDLAKHLTDDPMPKLRQWLINNGIDETELDSIENDAFEKIKRDFEKACAAEEPVVEDVAKFEFEVSPVTDETGVREPEGRNKIVMVDAALYAVEESMRADKTVLLYGQDVGGRLGGVFREAATLAQKFGDSRVFNTAIQEAYLVGSTAGMSAVGLKPIVEIQFCDYVWPGVNQLVTELSKSCYLSCGKFPVQSVIRVPVGAYGGGGPYHSGTHESALLTVRGIKIVYPSNAADMKGLMKAAIQDPNPVVMLEHKGLYWSKVPGTDAAKCVEPSEDYIIPLGKARIAQEASNEAIENGESISIITYGMGVHWALNASKSFEGQVEILDLRTLNPLDEAAVYESVRRHNKCIVLCEEQVQNSFAESLAGRISAECWEALDAPVKIIGALSLPAVPIHLDLEKAMLPNADKLASNIEQLLHD